MSGSQTTNLNHSAKHAAFQAFSNNTVEPTSLVEYTSQGRLLLIGSEQEIANVWNRVPETLTSSALLIGKKINVLKSKVLALII
ncbi:MAG: hypothetical protein V3V31_02295 [Methylococcales bacterium]